jgi:hypothetical protein
MRLTMKAVLFFALLIAAVAQNPPARAAEPYCVNPAHARPEKVPESLVPRVAAAFQIDASAARGGALVRCVGEALMGCFVGANLVCGKADTRRHLPGASAWCRANPGAANIPMAATGHATIYAWSCAGHRAVAGKTIATVDAQGYIAENWKEIH